MLTYQEDPRDVITHMTKSFSLNDAAEIKRIRRALNDNKARKTAILNKLEAEISSNPSDYY